MFLGCEWPKFSRGASGMRSRRPDAVVSGQSGSSTVGRGIAARGRRGAPVAVRRWRVRPRRRRPRLRRCRGGTAAGRHADRAQARWHVVAGRHLADEVGVAGELGHRGRQRADVEHPEWHLGVELGDGRCRYAARPHQRVHAAVGEPGQSIVRRYRSMSTRPRRPAASNSTSLVAAAPEPPGPIETRCPSRSVSRCADSGVAHDHLQIVLVHPGHRQRCGSGWAGCEIPLDDIGQCESQIDVP